MSFFEELKRRNVFRVGIAYAGEDVSRPYRFRLRTKAGL